MTSSNDQDRRSWQSHPARASAVRALVFLAPVAVSVVVGLLLGQVLPRASNLPGAIVWWTLVLGLSSGALFAADRLARRLLPLATLMRLAMLFPDQAPSRLKLARNISGSRAMLHELQHSGHVGGDRQQAAETILALVGALGDYDSRTRGHSERTQLFVAMLADELKLGKEDAGRLMWAAIVHDIGKLKVPHEVLNKPDRPTPEEWEVLQSHPHQGALICEPLREWLGEWWLAIEQHHERYDGQGYPRGLAGEEISYAARIVSVADSYEVMTAARPYKRPMTAVAAREELTRHAGTQFDPDVVRAFLNISLGRLHTLSGPLAWLLQVAMLRPGPLLGQVLGAAGGLAAATAAVVGLHLAPSLAADHHVRPDAHAAPGRSSVAATPAPTPARPPRHRPTPAPAPVRAPAAAPVAVVPARVSGSTPPTPTPPSQPTPTPPSPTTTPGPGSSTPPQPPSPPAPPPGSPTPPPPPPSLVLRDDTLTVDEDTVGSVDVLANDTADGPSPLTVVAVTTPSHGAATLVPGGGVLYTPDTDYAGPDHFTYEVRDVSGAPHVAHVAVTVRPTNDAPLAVPDNASVDEDGTVTVDVVANDLDVDGDTLSLVPGSLTAPSHGTAVAVGGRAVYHPNANWSGTDGFDYQVTDGHGGVSTGTVRVTVGALNDAPVAVPDTATVAEDGTVTVDVVGNDTDADQDPLTLVAGSLSTPANGTASEVGGQVAYSPKPNWYGTDHLTYDVQDGYGGTATGTLTVTVTPVDDPPVAVDDVASTSEDQPVTVAVLGNDTDVEGDVLHVRAGSVTDPAHGSVIELAGGLTYTPDPNWNGTDTFSYDAQDPAGGWSTATVTVTVDPVEDPPVAVDDTATVAEDGTVTVDVVGNDTDADQDPLTLVAGSLSTPANGTASEVGGQVAYSPKPNWYGTDHLTYDVQDGYGGTATGTLTVTVTPVDDPPVAVDDVASTSEDQPVTVAVLGNDTDVEGDTLHVRAGSVTDPAHGSVIELAGGLTYTPDPNWNGTDTFSYDAQDPAGGSSTATVTVTVDPVEDPPVAVDDTATVAEDGTVTVDVVGNDADADQDPLTLVAGSLSTPANGAASEVGGQVAYTPDPNYHGTDSFTYDVQDGHGGTATGTVTVTVTPVNDAPVAGPDAYEVQPGGGHIPAPGVLANDSDEDGDALTVTGDSSPFVAVHADGSVDYLALPLGQTVVSYTVSDGTTSTTGQLVLTTNLVPPAVQHLFLQAPTGTATLSDLGPTAPSGAVGDDDGDGSPGFTIKASDMKETEPNPAKYHIWSYPVDSTLSLDGPVTATLWTSPKFKANQDLDYAAWLYDCSSPSSCVRIASTVNVHVNNWSTSTTWQQRTVTIGSVSRTVPVGDSLQLRLAFNHSEVWIPFGTGYGSTLDLTD